MHTHKCCFWFVAAFDDADNRLTIDYFDDDDENNDSGHDGYDVND